MADHNRGDHHRSDHHRSVAGATIVITGASSGIGRGAALALAAAGARVVIAARRAEPLAELAEAIEAGGCSALAVEADVGRPADVARIAGAAVERFGRIDIWINNAGIGALGFFWDIPVEDHARIVDVNFKGVLYGAHEAIRRFRAQGHGTLINVGSIDSEVPLALQSTYAASKAAVLSLGRCLNEELRLAGTPDIRVGTIMPWAIDTPWWTHAANYTGHAPRMAAMDDPKLVIAAIVDACANPRLEQPVGWKAHASNLSHRVAPGLTERLSAELADREARKAGPMPPTSGALHRPMDDPARIDGGIRARMAQEDAVPTEGG